MSNRPCLHDVKERCEDCGGTGLGSQSSKKSQAECESCLGQGEITTDFRYLNDEEGLEKLEDRVQVIERKLNIEE